MDKEIFVMLIIFILIFLISKSEMLQDYKKHILCLLLIVIIVFIYLIHNKYAQPALLETSRDLIIDTYTDPKGMYNELDSPNMYNRWYLEDTNSFGDPKADGCCLFPEKPVCKRYTPEEIANGCCGRNCVGIRPNRPNFKVEQDNYPPDGGQMYGVEKACKQCRKQGEII